MKKGGIVFVFNRKRCYLGKILAILVKADEENKSKDKTVHSSLRKKIQSHLKWKCIFIANIGNFFIYFENLMFLIHTGSIEHKISEEI